MEEEEEEKKEEENEEEEEEEEKRKMKKKKVTAMTRSVIISGKQQALPSRPSRKLHSTPRYSDGQGNELSFLLLRSLRSSKKYELPVRTAQ